MKIFLTLLLAYFSFYSSAFGCCSETFDAGEGFTCTFSVEYNLDFCAKFYDCKSNDGGSPPLGGPACSKDFLNPPPEQGGGPKSRFPKRQCGSIINVDKLSVGESVEVVGTDMRLHYMSDRVIGRSREYSIKLPILEPTHPEIGEENVTKIIVENTWDGVTDVVEYSPGSVSDYNFTWDGLDRSGNEVIGPLSVEIALSYEYSDQPSLQRGRYKRVVGSYKPKIFGLGGWTLSEHHFLDIEGDSLYRGDGSEERIYAFVLLKHEDGTYEKEEPRRQPPAIAPSRLEAKKTVEEKRLSVKYAVASKDGERVFIFNTNGTHHETRSARTGALLLSFEYDQDLKLTSITDSYNRQILINRPNLNTVTITSVGGKVTSLLLNAEGYAEMISEPIGNLYQATYSSGGLINTFTEPGGKVSTFTYSAGGRLVEDSNNTGFRSVYEILNEYENTTSIKHTTKEGLETVFDNTFDESSGVNRMTQNPSGSTETFVDIVEGGTVYTEPDGYSYGVTYDKFERFEGHTAKAQSIDIVTGSMAESINFSSVENVINQDFFNLVSESRSINFDGRSWREIYSGANQEIRYLSPLERESKIKLNDFNQITQSKQANFLPIDYTYDALGRLSGITQGTRVWTYNYNLEDEVDSYTDPLGRVTSFIYDDNSRPIEVDNSGRVTKLQYDLNGNLRGVKPPGKPFHIFISELFNEIRRYFIPSIDGAPRSEINYSYDDDYRVTKIERPNGDNIDYTYDQTSGFLRFIDSPEGRYIRTYKQGTDQLQAVLHPSGLRTGFTYDRDLLKNTNVNYDNLITDSLTFYEKLKVDLKRVRARETDATLSARYLYDEDELLRRVGDLIINRFQDSGLTQTLVLNDIRESHVYDSDYGELRIRKVFSALDQSEFFKEVYIRDDLGRIRIRREFVNGVENKFRYVYDQQGKLRRVFKNDLDYKFYTYDANGNRLEEKENGVVNAVGSYDEADRLKTYGSYTFEYDDFGNLIKKVDTVAETQISYTHNSLGALKEVEIKDTFTDTVTDTITYINDGLGRRIARLKNGVFTNRYIYNEDIRIDGETNEDGTSLTQYIYGTRINVPDYMVRDDVRYKLITDYVGSVRMVVNAEDNTIVQEIEYDDFGRVLSDTNPGFQPFYFAGGLYDVDTKLTRFGAREYDAELARWISVDPIKFDGGTTNLYSYSFNDPVNYIDIDGKLPVVVIPIIVAAGAGFTGTFLGSLINGDSFFDASFNGALGAIGGAVGGCFGATLPAAVAGGLLSSTTSSLFNLGDVLGRSNPPRPPQLQTPIGGVR